MPWFRVLAQATHEANARNDVVEGMWAVDNDIAGLF